MNGSHVLIHKDTHVKKSH